jgi:cytoskeletal protein CcmA (bactofilin family)
MANSEIDTILGDDISFRGKLQFKNSLQINGRFKGSIATGGHLIVGPGAKVEADVEAGDVSIEGHLQGNVTATRRIDLLRNARLQGDLRTPDLQIASGSRFSGNCIMD